MRYFLFALICVSFPGIAAAAPANWKIIPEQSRVGFTAEQQGIRFDGKFLSFSGDIAFDETDLAGSSAKILIDTGSVSTGAADRDAELPKSEWFNSGVFPKAQFVTTAFRKEGGGFVADGHLTIRNKELPVSLPFTLTIAPAADGKSIAHAIGQLSLNRLDYDVGTGPWKDTSSVGNAVTVSIDLRAEKITP
jgi:polyisoprenoid-binding protein YceI